MPVGDVKLKSFEQIQDQGRVKSDGQDGLKTSTVKGKVVGFVQGRYKTDNAEVKQQFKAELKAKYGDAIANQLASEHGLDNTKGLSGRRIQLVLGRAKDLQNVANLKLVAKYSKSGEMQKIIEEEVKKNPDLSDLKNNPYGVKKLADHLSAHFGKRLYIDGSHGKAVLKQSDVDRSILLELKSQHDKPEFQTRLANHRTLETSFTHSNLASIAAKVVGNDKAAEFLDDHRLLVKNLQKEFGGAVEDAGKPLDAKTIDDRIESAFAKAKSDDLVPPPKTNSDESLVKSAAKNKYVHEELKKELTDVRKNLDEQAFYRIPGAIDMAHRRNDPDPIDKRPPISKATAKEFQNATKADARLVGKTRVEYGKESVDRPRRVDMIDLGRLLASAKIKIPKDVAANKLSWTNALAKLPPLVHDRLAVETDAALQKAFAELLTTDETKPVKVDSLEAKELVAAIRRSSPIQASKSIVKLDVGRPRPLEAPASIALDGTSYTLDKPLGKGAYGVAVRYNSADGRSIVAKMVVPDNVDESDLEESQVAARETIFKEAAAHRMVQGAHGHPNVVPLRGVARTEGDACMIVMDNVAMGDANDFFDDLFEKATTSSLVKGTTVSKLQAKMTREILQGGQYVQETGQALHGDMKPANLLLGADGKLKIADFGGSAWAADGENHPVSVTLPYAAPEGVQTQSPTIKHDQFSVGVMISQLYGGPGRDFFEKGVNASLADIFKNSWGQSDDVGIHKQGKDREGNAVGTGVGGVARLVNGLTSPKAEDRITFSAALQSSLLQDESLNDPKLDELMTKLAEWNSAKKNEAKSTTTQEKEKWKAVAQAHGEAIKKLDLDIGI